ncbi:MAG: hypothetical protein ICV87_07410 [Gemmatimonadetes bacterium]|nr:hypothetical protein [Gemmatimonadota bacterium]
MHRNLVTMSRYFPALIACALAAAPLAAQTVPPPAPAPAPLVNPCTVRPIERLGRNPTPDELRCRYGALGPGRFGLLSYLDVPVYQPATPLPGTHVVGVPGMPHPDPGESYEHWEWRILRTVFGAEVRRTYREMELLDPVFASRLRRMEQTLAGRGVRVYRRETWRSPQRQAWIFQQGRSRPGTFATSTLTSWHCRVDRLGRAAGRAADYNVAPSQMPAFHRAAAEAGLESYGADSNDPGHVYLPDTDAAAGLELAVLRLIPRVPHVTLATGRPDGEPQPLSALHRWRQLAQTFISESFTPLPAAEVVRAPVPRVGPPPRSLHSLPLPQ